MSFGLFSGTTTDKTLGGMIEELGAQMRVLHEDVISRIKVQAERSNGRTGDKRKR